MTNLTTDLASHIGTNGVISWWALLCSVAVINVTAWLIAAMTLSRRQAQLPAEIYSFSRLQLIFSALYVAGCAFRSALPVFDVPRLALFASPLTSALLDRSVATIAELSFVAQWALMLRVVASAANSALGKSLAFSLLPLIAVAELCSWYAVLTTANIGHVIEESIWGVSVALVVVALVAMRPRCPTALRTVLDACCIAGVAYVAFMFLVDVPMYWTRWVADEAAGRRYLSLWQGIRDAAERLNVSYSWQDWKQEVVWMSLYFSVAVWFSIWLIHAPLPRIGAVARRKLQPASST